MKFIAFLLLLTMVFAAPSTQPRESEVDLWLESLPLNDGILWRSEDYKPALDAIREQARTARPKWIPHSSGLAPYQPPIIPNPGENGPFTVLSQINITMYDPNRQAGTDNNLVEEGFTTCLPTSRNGVGRQWVVDGVFPGDPDGLLENPNWPKAPWYCNSIGNQSSVASSAWADRDLEIGYDTLTPYPGILLPVVIYMPGWCLPSGEYWDTITHHAHRGFAAFMPRQIVGDCFNFNFRQSVYNRAKDLTQFLDQLEAINALGSGHILSGRLDLNNIVFIDHSDSGNSFACLFGGSTIYNVTADPRVRNQLWLPRDPAVWESPYADLQNINTVSFAYSSQSNWGVIGNIRQFHGNQCPIAYLTRLDMSTHTSFAVSAYKFAEVAADTGNSVNSFDYCDGGKLGTVYCANVNSSAGMAYSPRMLAFTTFWDDVAINALKFQAPLWQTYLFLPYTYFLIQGEGYILHSKEGDLAWDGPVTAAALEREYDSYSTSSAHPSQLVAFAYKSLSSSGLYPGSSDPVFMDGDFNIPSKLPVPLLSIVGYWLPSRLVGQ